MKNRRLKTRFGTKNRKQVIKNENYLGIAAKVILNQTSAKKGFNIFGERVVAALFKKIKLLVEGAAPGKLVIVLMDPDFLSSKDRHKAMEAVN